MDDALQLKESGNHVGAASDGDVQGETFIPADGAEIREEVGGSNPDVIETTPTPSSDTYDSAGDSHYDPTEEETPTTPTEVSNEEQDSTADQEDPDDNDEVSSDAETVGGSSESDGGLDTDHGEEGSSHDHEPLEVGTHGDNDETATSSLPLKPPFRIVQLGIPRTGSTFQFRLLDILARMKSPNLGAGTYTSFVPNTDEASVKSLLLSQKSFVVKSHGYAKKSFWLGLQNTDNVALFSSADTHTLEVVNYTLYTQLKENLMNCSLCEVDRYKDLFGLTPDEVELAKNYMSLYEKVRKCCGMQMSRYNVMRLNGCNMTEYKDRPDYPHCEDYDMADVEQQFDSHPLPYTRYQLGKRSNNWLQVGDCAKYNRIVSSGKDFNYAPFKSCNATLNWKPPIDRSGMQDAVEATDASTPSDHTSLDSTQNASTDHDEGKELAAKKERDPLNTTSTSDETNETSREPLTPPFHVAQLGMPRTGSTFQFRLLDLLVRLKSPNGTEISTEFLSGKIFHESRLSSKQPNSSFVFKSHDWALDEFWDKFQTVGGIVFASADLESKHSVKFAKYIQLKENLANCSLCEVDRYKDMFALTEQEVYLVKRYMDLYEKIRLCCGKQMSKYNVMRLNGCNMTEYVDRPSYPHCEDHNMEGVEKEFVALGLPYTVMASDSFNNWVKPGDCAKFDKFIASGRGFNGRVFKSCEETLLGEDSKQKPKTVTKRPSTASSLEKKDKVKKRSHEEATGTEKAATILPVRERLKPPFRVVQVGVPRTGSTFQFRLLDVLVRMKSRSGENIDTKYASTYTMHDRLLARNSYVLKSHKYNQPERFIKAQAERRLVVFASADVESQHLVNFSDYIQLKEDLENCSLCEVDKYKDLFGLTQDEIKLVKRYMGLFEKIRKCCGTQMSKFNAMRLNGCNMTQYKDLPSYPHCEDYNFPIIEEEFDSLPLPYTVFSGDSVVNWVKPGDCAKFDEYMADGILFMTEPFTSCEDAFNWKSPSPYRM